MAPNGAKARVKSFFVHMLLSFVRGRIRMYNAQLMLFALEGVFVHMLTRH